MFIKISSLNEGVHNFSFEEDVRSVKLEDPFIGRFRSEFELHKSHHQLILNSEVDAEAHFECDRCGKDFETSLTTKYQIVYLFGNPPDTDMPDNVQYIPAEADKIKIGDDLRDYVMISIPMKKLCSEDCKGLCFRCGKDLNEGNCECEGENVDLRWLPLMELKKKLNNQ